MSVLPYTHFTLEERKYLQKLLEEGLSGNKIAAALGRSPSSISRELKRNSSKNPKKPTNRANYHHWRAHTLAMMRRRDHRRTALPPESFKRDYVCRGLSLFWSPEQIANRLRKDFPGQIVGISTIYRYLRRGDLPPLFPQNAPQTPRKAQGKPFFQLQHDPAGPHRPRMARGDRAAHGDRPF